MEKEIWLFNTKKTGMQGVNPFEGSSANKRTGLQTKVGGGTHRGEGLAFPYHLALLFGGGGLVKRAVLRGPLESLKPCHDPPPLGVTAPDRRSSNSVNTIQGPSKTY